MVIAIAMCFAAPQYVFTGNSSAENTVLGWFNVGYTPGSTDISGISISNSTGFSSSASNATSSFTSATNPAGGSGILGFIDPIFQIFSWVKLFFVVIFSPIILLTGPAMAGAPAGLVLLITLPLVFMTILGLIIWIRSGFA
jgi:hypothetical protein